MIEATDKLVADLKKALAKDGIRYETEFEYREAAQNLVSFVELAFEVALEQASWDRRLRDEPSGFTMAGGGRCCSLCSTCVSGDIWYTKWGLMCVNCHTAYDKKIVPGYVFKDSKNEKHATDWWLAHHTGLTTQTIRKLIRQGKIVARKVPNGPYVILVRDNPDIKAILQEEIERTYEQNTRSEG